MTGPDDRQQLPDNADATQILDGGTAAELADSAHSAAAAEQDSAGSAPPVSAADAPALGDIPPAQPMSMSQPQQAWQAAPSGPQVQGYPGDQSYAPSYGAPQYDPNTQYDPNAYQQQPNYPAPAAPQTGWTGAAPVGIPAGAVPVGQAPMVQHIVVQAAGSSAKRGVIGGSMLMLAFLMGTAALFVPLFKSDAAAAAGVEDYTFLDAFDGRGAAEVVVYGTIAVIALAVLALIGGIVALTVDGAAGGSFGLLGGLAGIAGMTTMIIWVNELGGDITDSAGLGFYLACIASVIGFVGAIVAMTRH